LIFKSFPLDGTCNKAMSRNGDGLTCKLAFAAFCADETAHKGWEAHHWIYDHQEEFQTVTDFPDKLHQLSQDLKLDEPKMNECINSDEVTQRVQAMAAEGANAKIDGTPSVFVNNKQFSGGQFLPFLDGMYQELKSGK
jgi:protein-disulfide isomerase